MDWTSIFNIIILIGTIAVALLNILNFSERTGNIMKGKKDKYFSEKLKETLDKLIPKYLEENDLKLRKELIQEIKTQHEKDLEEVKKHNEQQDKNNEILRHYIVDVLRQRIEDIYYKYRFEKKIPRFALENLEELYKDYKDAGGNHHIDKLYYRMKTWEITDELPEYDKE